MSRKTELKTSSTTSILEYILLIGSVCILAIRTTYTESPHITSTDFSLALGNDGISLLITTAVFGIVALWFIFRFSTGKAVYRQTGIETGLALFAIAACISIFAAANKRLAITDAVTIIAPVMLAIVMVQLLDRSWKIKLVLWILTALALAQTYQCADQCFVSNQMMIDQYEEEPQKQLEQLNIEPGSFNHMSYEHRLYSRDVKGYFTTGNSAGAFFIMAIAAGAALVFWDGVRKIRRDKLIHIVLLAAAIAGLALTHSKGAIGAFVLAAGMLGAFLMFGKKIQKYKWPLLIAVVLAGILIIAAVIGYGLKHGTLPGGNSLLVRWQYWSGAARMSADNPLTGVGGGNFGSH
ncbi:MAG: O-antigen ligase family protein, partial [Anaerohalosphaera sp.]|nr:O-antigen ligase family protein [Anaerohalosphaera sp.]